MKEPLFEPIFRWFRFKVALKDLKKILNKDSIILDYGCGTEANFYSFLKKEKIRFKKYFGFDPIVNKELEKKDLLITANWKKITKCRFDLIVMFAVIEHLPYPHFNYKAIIDLLKNNGYLIITTPTKKAKKILEFLSYKLGLVSQKEIGEHKHYFDLQEIEDLFKKFNLKVIRKKVFELGMNNYVLLRK